MAEVEGRELGWEDEISQESEFIVLPEGDYPFTIDRFERGRSSGEGKLPACNMATVFFRVTGDDGSEVTIKENYILHTKMEWKLSQLFRGVGLKKKDEPLHMNWTALPGLTGRCHIAQEPGIKDPSQIFNRISKVYPAEEKKFTAGKF